MMMLKDFEALERRKLTRWDVCLPIKYASDNLAFYGVALDLNQNGAFIRSDFLDTIGTVTQIDFHYISGKRIFTRSEVVWVATEDNRWKYNGKIGMGIKFLDANLEIQNCLSWYAQTYKERPKVVLIDDDPTFLSSITRYLEGFKIRGITLPDRGFHEKIIEQVDPVIIFLDYNMVNITPYEVVKILKANRKTKDIPLFLLSSEREDILKAFIKEYSVEGYISKDEPQHHIITTIQYYTNLRQKASTEPGINNKIA